MFFKKSFSFKRQKVDHETLGVIYQLNESDENLLNLDNSVSLHQGHLWFFVAFKGVSKTNPEFMWSYFICKNLLLYSKERALLCHCHLQSLHCVERILGILKVRTFELTFLILLNPVRQHSNLKEIERY